MVLALLYSLLINVGGQFLALLQGGIGSQSDACALPTTPDTATFRIWNYLYGSKLRLFYELSDLTALPTALTEAGYWSVQYTRDDIAAANATLHRAKASILAARDQACAATPASEVCCYTTTYAAWVTFAAYINNQTLTAYPDGCGAPLSPALRDRLRADMDARLVALWSSANSAAERHVYEWAAFGIVAEHELQDATFATVVVPPARAASFEPDCGR